MANWTTVGELDLVGRDDELRALERAAEGSALVTLRGPGGVGKTRLVEVWAHGGDVPVVELAGESDALGVVHAVAAALGVAVDPTRSLEDAVDRLGARLAGRRLVLDNLEQIDDLGSVLTAWVDAGARFVLTSRRSLGVAGERVVDVAPLSVDDASALFERRVGHAHEPAEVRALIEAVDAMPFAVELAARRAVLMSPVQLVDRVQQLSVGGDRHASVESCLRWSWDLLTPERRSQWAALGLFRIPWTLEDAEAVVGSDAVDTVEELLDASLIVRRGGSPVRFTTLALVRGFVAPRADAEACARWRARVLERAAEADRAGLLTLRPELHAVLRHPTTAAAERTAVRAAIAPAVAVASQQWLGWFATHEEDVAAADRSLDARASVAFAQALQWAGQLEMAGKTVDAALRRLGEVADPARGWVLAQRARQQIHTGRWGDARADLDEAVKVLERDELATAYERLGDVHRLEGRLDDAERAQRQALELYRSSAHRGGQASTWIHLAHIAGLRGDRDAAVAAYERAESLLDSDWDRACLLVNRLNYEASSGDPNAALDLTDRTLAACDALGSQQLRAMVLALACVASLPAGESSTRALERGARALPTLIESGQQGTASVVRMMNAAARILDGELDLAEASIRAARDANERAGLAVPRTAAALEVFLAVLRGRPATIDGLERGHLPSEMARSVVEGDAERVRELAARADRVGELAAVRVAARIALRCLTSSVRVAADGTAVVSGDTTHDLSRRGASRRILVALAAELGETVTSEALIDAGWPGQRILADAARMRLHTAIRTLRTLGLEAVLHTVEGGYSLDASVVVEPAG